MMAEHINDIPQQSGRSHLIHFFVSEVLHSPPPSSKARDSPHLPASETDEQQQQHSIIIICHKDKRSFYKSTRKIGRAAIRVWSTLFSTTTDCNVCDGYYISAPEQSSSDNHEAIQTRLTSEFGPCCDTIAIDNMTVLKYSSKDAVEEKKSANKEEFDVIFLDVNDADSGQVSLGWMQNMLSTLKEKVISKEKSAIIHLRSESIHRIVSNTSKNGSSPYGISGAELKKYILSGGSINRDEDSAPIRRLRDKKGASNCPLTIYPARYIEIQSSSDGSAEQAGKTVEICRFHNYDTERGCLRSKKAQINPEVKGCDMDHKHCHRCGGEHRAFECPNTNTQDDGTHRSSVVFRKDVDGNIISIPFDEHNNTINTTATRDSTSLPALLVLGGRLRGRTLATCEMLPLSSSDSSNSNDTKQWMPLPNLYEHRGSHAACSAAGTNLVFVLGGGTADGNSDAIEILDFSSTQQQQTNAWHTMEGKLSSPRHAFGAVSCVTSKQQTAKSDMISVSLYAVGGWQYGSVSCESMERLNFQYPTNKGGAPNHFDIEWLYNRASWELCAPLLLPRRLHSVATSADGTAIYVFGGYIDERRTTPSIERYDIVADKWSAFDKLPFGEHNCPLVQAVAYQTHSFLVFPYSIEQSDEDMDAPLVLRYTPGSDTLFTPISIRNGQQLRLPIVSWHSFSATLSTTLNKVFLVGGTVKGKWTNRSYELDLSTLEWTELPKMTFARRRLATVVLE